MQVPGRDRLRMPRGWTALLLGLLLVSVQTLGLLHSVLHAPGSQAARVLHTDTAPVTTAPAGVTSRTDATGHFLLQLFSGHQGSADCHLYDVLSQGDLATSTPVMLALPTLPVALSWAPVHTFCARRLALFDARGPPLSR
ncbi:MAG: hypothetical protein KKE95_13475 [Gammaproteobacteria bacterium]|nr:hypothetical protein [Gammaproteobacteria bacterium]